AGDRGEQEDPPCSSPQGDPRIATLVSSGAHRSRVAPPDESNVRGRLRQFRAGARQVSEFFQDAFLVWALFPSKEAPVSALRRISTRRLLAICAITALAAVGITAAGMAMGGSGPKPPSKPLANAVTDALNAPSLPGVSARIQFTNNLVDASSIQGADPLIAGASGRLWASPAEGGKLRLEVQSAGAGGDTQV